MVCSRPLTVTAYNTSDFKKGLKVILDNEPHLMIEMEFMKPGKGQAVYRTKLRNLIRGTVIDRTYRSGDKLDSADVTEGEAEYLYADATTCHFMNSETFEQFSISKETLGDTAGWLKTGMTVYVVYWEERPISVEPPNHVELAVTYVEPAARGNTATNVQKPATLETGAVVPVPAFINIGDVVKVDTRTGEYVERVS